MHYDARHLLSIRSRPLSNDSFDFDAALVACARGDAQALRQLYEREGRQLLGVALRIVRQRAQAEDVLHDAFVSIWRRASSFDAGRGEGRGWVYSVVRHAALNAVRRTEREVDMSDEDAYAQHEKMLAQTQPHGLDPYERVDTLGRLDACLSQLEPARRDCIVLAYVDGCSHGEIAARTRTPLGTVKAWIQRGLRALRACMA